MNLTLLKTMVYLNVKVVVYNMGTLQRQAQAKIEELKHELKKSNEKIAQLELEIKQKHSEQM